MGDTSRHYYHKRVREEALILHSNGMSMRAIPIIWNNNQNTYNEITNYLVPGSILNYIQDSVTGVNVEVNVELDNYTINNKLRYSKKEGHVG